MSSSFPRIRAFALRIFPLGALTLYLASSLSSPPSTSTTSSTPGSPSGANPSAAAAAAAASLRARGASASASAPAPATSSASLASSSSSFSSSASASSPASGSPPGPPVRFAIAVFRHGARAPLTEEYGAGATRWAFCGKAFEPAPVVVVGPVGPDGIGTPRPHHGLSLKQEASVFPGGCHKGQLTTLGQRQARRLGEWLRGRYATGAEGSLLPPEWQDGLVAVRSTNLSRTVATAAGVLTGLYPGGTGSTPVPVATIPDREEYIYPNSQVRDSDRNRGSDRIAGLH